MAKSFGCSECNRVNSQYKIAYAKYFFKFCKHITTNLLSNGTNSLLKVMKIRYGQLSDKGPSAEKLISFDSIVSVFKPSQ